MLRLSRPQSWGRSIFLGVCALAVLTGGLFILAPWRLGNEATPAGPCWAATVSPKDNEGSATCRWESYQQGLTSTGVVATFTVEGDPITYSIRVLSRNAIRVTVQSQDKYGPRGRFDYTCSGLALVQAANGVGHLAATGCQGPAGYVDDAGRLTVP